jgi:hypothetical protein
MDLPKNGFDPATLELIAQTLDAAWEEVEVENNDANSTALRALMAARLRRQFATASAIRRC